ncbi:MAG: DUF1934 domain-containing protein [Lachnospiraceae bacterium]|jgi:uncharacterized beta-barrel protein YwiB (DUF1934 family)|nr:DUF1934 domain-containing protein [Lachnospiraceae bacterium]
MTENVWLTITGEQTQPDGSHEKNTTKSRARHVVDADGTHELYFHEEINGVEEPVENRVTIASHRITVEKTGKLNTNLVLENGRTNACLYETPYGSFSMDIVTTNVACLEVGERVHARAKYQLHMEGEYCVDCAVTIRIDPMTSG